MSGKPKYTFIEELEDRHGVIREYGYDKYGRKFFINMREVRAIYKSRGIDDLREVI
jgi:hypothetical protein